MNRIKVGNNMGKRTVYNMKTGKPATVDAIDAKEYLATGGWSTEPVVIKEKPILKKGK
jgi:hypothetical protein